MVLDWRATDDIPCPDFGRVQDLLERLCDGLRGHCGQKRTVASLLLINLEGNLSRVWPPLVHSDSGKGEVRCGEVDGVSEAGKRERADQFFDGETEPNQTKWANPPQPPQSNGCFLFKLPSFLMNLRV